MPPFILTVNPAAAADDARRVSAALPGGGVLYYALGGGLGHLTRAEAVARQWTRACSEPFTLLTNCRFTLPISTPQLRLDHPEPRPEDLGTLVSELVSALQPRLLVVDAFPAGILGELSPILPRIDCRKVAVLRRLQPHWVERWNLPTLLPRHYDGVAVVEDGARFDGFPTSLPCCEAGPVLIRDAGELLPQQAARATLRTDGAAPVLLVSMTGARPADQGLVRLCERLGRQEGAEVRVVTPFPQGSLPGRHLAHFPLLEWLPGVDVLVGPSGYNLFHEARATRTPAIWVPQRRQYDDQLARATGHVIAHTPGELERLLHERLHLGREWREPAYTNGAGVLAGWLLHLGELPYGTTPSSTP